MNRSILRLSLRYAAHEQATRSGLSDQPLNIDNYLTELEELVQVVFDKSPKAAQYIVLAAANSPAHPLDFQTLCVEVDRLLQFWANMPH